ncbi:PTS system trehalose-specific IIC component [Olsenella profusa DSM 13989]|uniref:PTS system trehalose-specific EIIBC component n=1 Tax=Olsenella profusa TaxID=138595 RepID=UPI002784A71A|nr:PTS system trehalose-specific EIIBC component [Olsenella profusa]MDP9858397.1 PTS system trehalose-specific IIC component [Olsenella profusa DSM 13989]
MGKYESDARELLRLVGGRENIVAVTHCVTRMRFALVDPGKADVPGIERLKAVKGSFTNAGQFQVIIGNDVADFYDDFTAVSGVSEVSKADVKKAAAGNQNPFQRAMGAIAEVFAPLIPAIITGGLILGFRNVLGDMPYFGPDGTQTLASLSVFWTGVYNFLWLIGEAVFHLGIPVGICYSITKKMGGTPMLGIVLGLTLVSGQLMNAYGVASATAEDWATHTWDFGFAQVHMIGYQAQVIPAILAAVCFNYYERFFKRITPAVVQMIVVPFCSILLGVMTAHFIVGPIGWTLGTLVSNVVMAGISGQLRVIFGALFGGLYAPLVITGLHHMTNAIDLQLIADTGTTMLWPMIALSNIAQGSAVLAMIVLQRRDEDAQQVNIPACLSCYLGVTEPAMFGVNLKYVFPFACAMIGSALAGILCTATSTAANAIGVGGLPGILSINSKYFLSFAVCMLVAIVVPFALTFVVGKRKGIDRGEGVENVSLEGEDLPATQAPAAAPAASDLVADGTIRAAVSGTIRTLASVDDGVFSSGMMGPGIAIDPSAGEVVAPCDGEVTVMMAESGHAVGLKLPNDLELLVHVGLDTVDMHGKGFTAHVRQGDVVHAGQRLITFDHDTIKAADHPDTVMMVVTGTGQAGKVELVEQGSATAGETTVITY